MAKPLGNFLVQLRRMLGPAAAPSSDGELLQRYAADQDQAAFAALVERYAALVYGVCRRVLPEEHDAEDAFQATFVILTRKAGTLATHASIAGWLHTVAMRAALKARTRAARRQSLERQAAVMLETPPDDAAIWRDLAPMLDEEVNRLPERCRAPVVLCYLAGKTNVEAAAELNWSRDMVRRRLAEAADLLRQRLTRRGVTLGAGALPALLAASAQGAAPPAWTIPLLQGSASLSQPAVDLAEGVLRDMFIVKCKLAAVMVLTIGAAMAAAGVAAQRLAVPPPEFPVAVVADAEPPPLEKPAQFQLGGRVDFVALSPDARLVAAADNAGKIVIWDRAAGKEVRQLRVDDPPDPNEVILNRNASRIPPPTYFAIAPDNKTLAAVAGDDLKSGRTFYLFDLTTGRKLHRSVERTDRVAFSPDGRTVVLWGPHIALWETATQRKRATLDNQGGSVNSVAFAGDGRTLAAVQATGAAREYCVQRWDLATGQPGAQVRVRWGPRGGAFADVVCAAQGDKLAVVWGGTVAGFDAAGKEYCRADLNHAAPGWARLPQAAFTSDGALRAAAAEGMKATVTDVAKRAQVFEVTAPGKNLRHLALTADGRRLLAGNEAGQVFVWPLPAEK